MGAVNKEAERLAFEEVERHVRAMTDLVVRWPEHRLHIALGMLGSAIAFADTFGADAEAFLADLREQTVKPDVLVAAERA